MEHFGGQTVAFSSMFLILGSQNQRRIDQVNRQCLGSNATFRTSKGSIRNVQKRDRLTYPNTKVDSRHLSNT